MRDEIHQHRGDKSYSFTLYFNDLVSPLRLYLSLDVAARGLDLPEVDWILQYDPPCDTTDVSTLSPLLSFSLIFSTRLF